MAGEFLLKMMNSRGGKPNEYADIVFGRVISTSPLQVQLANNMILPASLLTLGLHVTKHQVKLSYPDRINEDKKDIQRTETVTVDESLQVGEGVAMIRSDGGQSFYILEKIGAGD